MTVKMAPIGEGEEAIDALITWYDDLIQGRAPSVARRRAIVTDLRRANFGAKSSLASDIDLLTRPDPAYLKTNSLLAIERLRQHRSAAERGKEDLR